MRIFGISDLHIDFMENKQWLYNISRYDYVNDYILIAGDISDIVKDLAESFEHFKKCFKRVFFVPGNHDLWIKRNSIKDSIKKYDIIKVLAKNTGVEMETFVDSEVAIVPLLGWYDYSFGEPCEQILGAWRDFDQCKWPYEFSAEKITNYFCEKNNEINKIETKYIISFSHFLPRIDLMPFYIPVSKRIFYPVLGSVLIENKIREIGSNLHLYGHSHVNRNVTIKKIKYCNNAFGYPYETNITNKELSLLYEY